MPDTVTKHHLGARRVRHPLLLARWPTREEAAAARWFSPIQFGKSVVARERTWVPAMVPWRATEDGFVSQDVLDCKLWDRAFTPGDAAVRLSSDEKRRLVAPPSDAPDR